jgi:heme-degrading monooxygenase HmoA
VGAFSGVWGDPSIHGRIEKGVGMEAPQAARSSEVTVITTITVASELQEELVKLSLELQPMFARQPGFIVSALHRSIDCTQLVQYLEWDSLEAYQDSIESREWEGEAGSQFLAFIETSEATLERQFCELVSVLQGPVVM